MDTDITIFVIKIIVIVVVASIAILQLLLENSDKDIGRTIVEVGSALLLSEVSSVVEMSTGFFSALLGINVTITNSGSQFSWINMVIGIILIVIGVLITYRIKKPVYILNMVGQSKREINTGENEKSLHIAGYKIKEQVIDIIPIFGNGDKIDKKTNGFIIRQIGEEVNRFTNRTEYLVSQLLQLAPIGVSCSTLEYSDQYCIFQRARVGT